MKQCKYSIKRLIDNHSFVAEVELQITENNLQSRIVFEFDEGCFQYSLEDLQIWRTAVSYGVVYAIEHLSSSDSNKDYFVQFNKINGYIVDTSSILLTYAACLAAFDAFSINSDKIPIIDERTKLICFPK